MIAILEDESAKGAFPAVLHCFSSGAELARRGLALGLYLSFSGILTFKNSQDIRGKRNQPAYVRHTADVLAEVKGVSREDITRITTENALRLFSKLPPMADA